jgi:hypothetical protein
LYWHIVVGRDTFWIPPHTMMYTAVAVSGLTALVVVLSTTLRNPSGDNTTSLLGFRAPLGFFVLGFGALQMVMSAPFDDLYHRLYGVDVTVWSPPHLVGFSGAITMLVGLVIATCSERNRLAARDQMPSRLMFWLLALLLALVVRWISFLNSTTLQLSWVLEEADHAVAGPWAPWWGLWAGLFMTWTFVASARLWPGREVSLPLAVAAMVVVVRALEFPISALGFQLVLPWGSQTLNRPFVPFFDWDLGLWVTTLVLVLPMIAVVALARWGKSWSSRRFGLLSGALCGLLLAGQFLALRPVLELIPLSSSVQLEVVLWTIGSGILGGLIGARQGDWLAKLSQ